MIAGPNTDTVGGVPNNPSQLGTSGTTNHNCAPAEALGISGTNKTQAYFGRSVLGAGSNVVGQTSSNPGSTNLMDLDKDRYHAGASGARLWPAVYSTAEEKTAAIRWPASGTDSDVMATSADVAYGRILGVDSNLQYGAGVRLVFSGPGFASFYALGHDTLDWRIIFDVMGRSGSIKFNPEQSEIPR